MKLVIDIDDKLYEDSKKLVEYGFGSLPYVEAIANGTPYEERPKGKWELFEKRPYINLYMCSNCEHIIESMPDRLAENFKGCYCGADMR